MNGDQLLELAKEFGQQLKTKKKSSTVTFSWYPYGTLANFIHLREAFNNHPLESLATSKRVADIGGADGDLAFFLQSIGCKVDVIDNAPTNFNGLQGVKTLINMLGVSNSVTLIEKDIDEQFCFQPRSYDLAFLLGVLYHLKNPFYILENLSRVTRNLVISTRIMRCTPDGKQMAGLPVAYLLNPDESNNDATNYWIFTESALERLVDRAGWDIAYSTTVGDKVTSNPSSADKDERAFMLLKSRLF